MRRFGGVAVFAIALMATLFALSRDTAPEPDPPLVVTAPPTPRGRPPWMPSIEPLSEPEPLDTSPEGRPIQFEGTHAADAMSLYRAGRAAYREGDTFAAIRHLSAARDLAPHETGLCLGLAQAYDRVNLTRDAVELLPCLERTPERWRERVAPLIERIERSAEYEQEFALATSNHFVASYSERSAAREAIGAILDVLERAHAEIGTLTGLGSSNAIPVVLYEGDEFIEAANAPHWAVGFYDGKIRVPVDGIDINRDLFEQTLEHELVHAMLHERTGSRVPAWLHEGLANYLSDHHYADAEFEHWRNATSSLLPIESLTLSFRSMNRETAALAYQQAYWMTRDLVDDRGWRRIQYLLGDLESDPARRFDAAFSAVYRQTPGEYLDDWYDGAFGP